MYSIKIDKEIVAVSDSILTAMANVRKLVADYAGIRNENAIVKLMALNIFLGQIQLLLFLNIMMNYSQYSLLRLNSYKPRGEYK